MIKFTQSPFVLPGYPLIEQALNIFRIAVEGFVRDVNRNPLITGNHLTGVTVTTSWGKVYHKLGKVPQGWVLTSIDGRDSLAERTRTDKYIELRSTGTVTVSLWVF